MANKHSGPRQAATRGPFRPAAVFALAGLSVAIACGESPTETTMVLPVVAYNHVGLAPGDGRPFDLDLSQEVTSTFTGDPDGAGTALLTLNHGQQTICWSLTVWNIALPATASHIHRAPTGLAGPIVVGITAPGASGTSSGCVSGVDRDLLRDILTSPESYYINVHTTQHPPGAIRSQLR
jgi:hypothetical protein